MGRPFLREPAAGDPALHSFSGRRDRCSCAGLVPAFGNLLEQAPLAPLVPGWPARLQQCRQAVYSWGAGCLDAASAFRVLLLTLDEACKEGSVAEAARAASPGIGFSRWVARGSGDPSPISSLSSPRSACSVPGSARPPSVFPAGLVRFGPSAPPRSGGWPSHAVRSPWGGGGRVTRRRNSGRCQDKGQQARSGGHA